MLGPRLHVSRSIGNVAGAQLGSLTTPSSFRTNFKNGSRMVVLANSLFWSTLATQEVVDKVLRGKKFGHDCDTIA